MGRTLISEALVLKTYDIGNADRLCVLLIASLGRTIVTAKGVRKLSTKWSSALQSFQHIRVHLAEHSSGLYLRSAESLSSCLGIRKDIERFTLASRGSEILLCLLHGTEPNASLFALAREYFDCCDGEEGRLSLLFPSFLLMLLAELGLLPSFEEGRPERTPALQAYLCSQKSLRERADTSLSKEDRWVLTTLCTELLQDHLSFPLRSGSVSVSRD